MKVRAFKHVSTSVDAISIRNWNGHFSTLPSSLGNRQWSRRNWTRQRNMSNFGSLDFFSFHIASETFSWDKHGFVRYEQAFLADQPLSRLLIHLKGGFLLCATTACCSQCTKTKVRTKFTMGYYHVQKRVNRKNRVSKINNTART